MPMHQLVPLGNPEVNVWDVYNQKAALADADLTSDFNSSMDVLLIFVSVNCRITLMCTKV